MNHIVKLGLLGLTALVTACASEPSAGDIEKEIKAQVAASQEAIGKMAGSNPQIAEMAKSMQITVHGVNKIGCKSDGDKAYTCDVEMDLETDKDGRKKKTVPVRMVKGSEGWVMSGV